MSKKTGGAGRYVSMKSNSSSISTDWMNARMRTTLLALVLGAKGEGGALIRGEVEYDVLDALVASAGFVGYVPGSRPPVDGWGKNQRAFLMLKYSF